MSKQKIVCLEELKEKARLTDEELWESNHKFWATRYGKNKVKDYTVGVTIIQAKEFIKAQQDKDWQTFIQFCEENKIYQVVEGELPEVPLWATRDGTEIRGADAVFKLALQDMKLWHKQSLKPVSSLLKGADNERDKVSG